MCCLQLERMAVTEPDQLEELAAQLSITKALKAGATRLLETAKWTPVQKVGHWLACNCVIGDC